MINAHIHRDEYLHITLIVKFSSLLGSKQHSQKLKTKNDFVKKIQKSTHHMEKQKHVDLEYHIMHKINDT